MKKINSNGYGYKVIGLAALFLVAVPLCFFILGLLFTMIFTVWIYLSLIIGSLILILFTVWLLIEFCQDRKISREYIYLRKKKLSLGNGKYECQACGSKNVIITDKCCGICGMTFVPEE